MIARQQLDVAKVDFLFMKRRFAGAWKPFDPSTTLLCDEHARFGPDLYFSTNIVIEFSVLKLRPRIFSSFTSGLRLWKERRLR